jgi:hypothetical protein
VNGCYTRRLLAAGIETQDLVDISRRTTGVREGENGNVPQHAKILSGIEVILNGDTATGLLTPCISAHDWPLRSRIDRQSGIFQARCQTFPYD